MILESFEKAEEDFAARQVLEARVEADNILRATDKAKQNDAWLALTGDERAAVDRAIGELLVVYHAEDHHLILQKIESLNAATQKLAETMMNAAVGAALKGTHI